MPTVNITKEKVQLFLTQAIGKVRISDQNGNHVKKPTSEGKNKKGYDVEWWWRLCGLETK